MPVEQLLHDGLLITCTQKGPNIPNCMLIHCSKLTNGRFVNYLDLRQRMAKSVIIGDKEEEGQRRECESQGEKCFGTQG